MAKGNMFQGMARGAVGDVVFSVVKGQQVTKVRNRQPSNPRTASQVLQRAIFSTAVKFYTRGIQNLFQFAFEDKKSTESDYNAFMRRNAKLGMYITQEDFNNPNYPAVGTFFMSYGSLTAPTFTEETVGETSEVELKAVFPASISSGSLPTTIGELSQNLIDGGSVEQGDIVTLVRIFTNQNSGTSSEPIVVNEFSPSWDLLQFTVDVSSSLTLANAGIEVERDSDGNAKIIIMSLYDNQTIINAGTAIVSRKTSSGLKVSTARLQLSPGALTALNYGTDAVFAGVVKTSWGAREEAILEGSESVN